MLFTIIENCHRPGINPYNYLMDVITRLPRTTNHQTHTLTPRAWAREKQQIKLAALKRAS